MKRGWLLYPIIHETPLPFSIKATIVVCARNESTHIAHLLTALMSQSYINREIIVVDDGSTDNTVEIVHSFAEIILVALPESVGKKAALRKGLEHATGELIICTDADCVMGNDWIRALVNCYQIDFPDMIIGPVRIHHPQSSLLQHLQSIEFMSLAASTAGSASIGRPIMCNGANLAFTKEAWNTSSHELKDCYASGDDMFLMESIKSRGGKIRYAKFQEAIVTTEPVQTFSSFFHQRSRWVSKSAAYSDPEIKFVAGLVASVTLLPFLLALIGVFDPWFFLFSVLSWGIKTGLDYRFLRIFRPFFVIFFPHWQFLLVAVLYPFYVIVSLILGKFRKVIWK